VTVTTKIDHSGREDLARLVCPTPTTDTPSTLTLALRDMRTAHGRDPETGAGVGNESLVALVMAMIVLDTLAGKPGENVREQGKRFRRLLTDHQVEQMDAEITYAVRCSLLHGYGIPGPSAEGAHDRRIVLTPATDEAYAIDTDRPGLALLSVPVFCCRLTERVAAEASASWDETLVDVSISLESLSSLRRPVRVGGLGQNIFRLADDDVTATGNGLPAASGAWFDFDSDNGRRPAPTTGPPPALPGARARRSRRSGRRD
jgi:hypothetical protein